jgi:hypothetical protein
VPRQNLEIAVGLKQRRTRLDRRDGDEAVGQRSDRFAPCATSAIKVGRCLVTREAMQRKERKSQQTGSKRCAVGRRPSTREHLHEHDLGDGELGPGLDERPKEVMNAALRGSEVLDPG